MILTLRVKMEAAATFQIQVTYELPGATWEVVHDVRIENENEVTIVFRG